MLFHSWNVIHREKFSNANFFSPFDDTKTHLIAAETSIKLNKRMLSSFPLIFDSQHLTSINFYIFSFILCLSFLLFALEIIERKYFPSLKYENRSLHLFVWQDVPQGCYSIFCIACQETSLRFDENLLVFTLRVITHI